MTLLTGKKKYNPPVRGYPPFVKNGFVFYFWWHGCQLTGKCCVPMLFADTPYLSADLSAKF